MVGLVTSDGKVGHPAGGHVASTLSEAVRCPFVEQGVLQRADPLCRAASPRVSPGEGLRQALSTRAGRLCRHVRLSLTLQLTECEFLFLWKYRSSGVRREGTTDKTFFFSLSSSLVLPALKCYSLSRLSL